MPQPKPLVDRLTVPLLIAAILGGIEMRVRVGALQSGHEETTRRLERIERMIDSRALAQKDD